MEIAAKLFGAIIPGLSLLTYFYLKDRFQPEPLHLVIRVFISGGLVVFPLLVIQRGLAPYNSSVITDSFIFSGLLEEFIKWFLMYYLVYHHTEFDEFYDGIVYCVAIAAGFATVENVFYIFLSKGHSFTLIWNRAFLPVSGHILFGITMGYYFAKMKTHYKVRYRVLSLVLPAFLHGMFNALNSYPSSKMQNIFIISYMGFLWWFGIKKMNLGLNKLHK